mmetsp:Transcript_59/g.83  ORF Transcript_59/g.83 Transcript_59/m.83 type:complete len:681 (+) Transcript_59:27-2069(+)
MASSKKTVVTEPLQPFGDFFDQKARSSTSSVEISQHREDAPEMKSPSSSMAALKLNLQEVSREVEEALFIKEVYGGSPKSDAAGDVEEKSLVSSSAFFDSPRNYVYSESSANETPRLAPTSKSLTVAKLKEVSFGKGNDLRSVLNSDRPLALTVELLNSQIEHIEKEVTGAFKSLSKRIREVEDGIRSKGGEDNSFKDEVQSLKGQIKQIQLRVEKAELENTDFTIDSRKHQRTVDERLATLERKETAKLRLFEELGNEIDSIKSVVSEGLQGANYKSMYENLRLRQEKHDKVLGHIQQQLEERSYGSGITPKMKEDIKSIILHTISELTEARTLDVQTDIEIDKLRGQIRALETELLQRTPKKDQQEHEQTPHRCNQVVKAVKKIDRRIGNVEDYLSKESGGSYGGSQGQSPPASFRSNSAQLVTVLSKLEDRLAEIEREQVNHSSTKRRVADVVKRVKMLEDRTKAIKDSELRTATPKHYEGKDESIRLRQSRKSSALSYQQDSSLVHCNESSLEMNSGLYEQPPAPDNVSYLQDRIAKIEKLRLHKQAYAFKTEAQVRPPSPSKKAEKTPEPEPTLNTEASYTPGDTEALVMNAIAERVSKLKLTERLQLRFGGAKALSPLSASFNSLGVFSAAQSPKNSASTSMIFRDESRFPSEELQEQLKLRGFQVKDSKQTRH